MFCAISGSAPEEPVVSQKSGHLFEKRLVVKAIKDTGLCPITGEPLGEDDLLELKANKAVKPRPTQATSVPGLLSLFHNEWDALVLETHSMRQSLHTVRQELSHALYQHDAACRVIARLSKERDEARAALEQVSAAAAARSSPWFTLCECSANSAASLAWRSGTARLDPVNCTIQAFSMGRPTSGGAPPVSSAAGRVRKFAAHQSDQKSEGAPHRCVTLD